jgi:pyruvate,water dikinase
MRYIRQFSEIGINDIALVGGKNASLGEMYQNLSAYNIKVPNGFATTADGYRHYLQHNNLEGKIADALANINKNDIESLINFSKSIRGWIMHAEMPDDLLADIQQGYSDLEKEYGVHPDVAVRSSATAEDLPTASFAGQQESYLNITGIDNLVSACKRVYASLFTDRAISYRIDQGFSHMDVALSIGIQKMVRSDLGVSGVMFTLDTESGFRDVILINGAYGLGENIVQGSVNPDEFHVFKQTLASGFRPIIKRQLGDKAIKMIYTKDGAAGISTRNIPTSRNERDHFCLNDDEILELARYGTAIEHHYSKKAGRDMPMDIEWAKDGNTGELFVLQARPETVQSQQDQMIHEVYKLESRGTRIATGKSIGRKIAMGEARVIIEAADMRELKAGEVLVTDITDPDWEPVMKIASAIVTNRGGRTCHAAIIARELGVPAVVGTGDGTQAIHTGQEITVSCAVSKLPCDGVGLARLEFIINNSIQIHPRALLEYDQLDPATQKKIDKITAGYADRKTFYINRLAEGIATIAAAFYPRPVIVRMSDFKSNEYASLIGGTSFEPREENPMIGFRGASRYFSESFTECFAMECAAIYQVRNNMGLTNVSSMIPFVRTIEEGANVLDLMAKHQLKRGEDGFNVFLMCEIPANAILAEQFLEYFDGMSIGSNDLTQLTLGVDRDSSLISSFDERNPAVLKLMNVAIKACRKQNKYVGICGQAPSDYPEITKWLVEHGIQSISLNPDSILDMTEAVWNAENNLVE